jgi:SOS-response transcriptional repressor LexA
MKKRSIFPAPIPGYPFTTMGEETRSAYKKAAQVFRQEVLKNIMSKYKPNKVFEFIVDFKKDHDGNSPTVREIAKKCKISSISTVSFILDELDESGKIKLLNNGQSRQIHVVGGSWTLNPS